MVILIDTIVKLEIVTKESYKFNKNLVYLLVKNITLMQYKNKNRKSRKCGLEIGGMEKYYTHRENDIMKCHNKRGIFV